MTKRDTRLDTVRGILLVIMTFNHLSGDISKVTSEPFGFVSAAEGFVLLSAYTTAITSKCGGIRMSAMFGTGLRRAWRIYKYHAVVLLLLAVIAWGVPVYHDYWSVRFLTTDGSLEHTVAAGLLLFHRPAYFDILPMYVIFSLLTPFMLYLLRGGYGAWLLIVSVIFWGIGQAVHPVPDVSDSLGWEGNAGLFNILSWQVLWVAGLFIGFIHVHVGTNPAPRHRGILAIAAVVALLCFLYRHGFIVLPQLVFMYFDKAELSSLRLVNVAAHVVLALYTLTLLRRDWKLPWFSFIGRYSLQVFTYHVFIVYALLPLGWRIDALAPGAEAVLHILVVISLTIPAWLYQRLRRRAGANSVLPEPGVPA